MSTGTQEIALIPQIDNPGDLFVPNGLDPIIENITAQVEAIRLDISTETGRKEVASVAYRVARSKNAIDEAGKKLGESIKAKAKLIDIERRRAWDALEALQKRVRAPLDEWEAREKNRIAKYEAELTAMQSLRDFNGSATSQEIQARLNTLNGYKGREWEEFYERAKVAFGATAFMLTQMLEAAQKAEAERADLERLRKEETERKQRERDEKLQAEAAERARLAAEAKAKAEADILAAKVKEEAERVQREKKAAEDRAAKAEADKKAALAKAESDKKAAEAKAKRDAEEAVRRERERVEAIEKAQAIAQAKREANKKHRAKINGEAFDALVAVLDELGDTHDAGEGDRPVTSGDQIEAIIEAIADGRIPHIVINY
jgi:hypothetical protein